VSNSMVIYSYGVQFKIEVHKYPASFKMF
jgi:hypothetical protein